METSDDKTLDTIKSDYEHKCDFIKEYTSSIEKLIITLLFQVAIKTTV